MRVKGWVDQMTGEVDLQHSLKVVGSEFQLLNHRVHVFQDLFVDVIYVGATVASPDAIDEGVLTELPV